MALSDAQMELEQQQLMIDQLKALIRERDEVLQNKDKELQETNSKLTKLRLQAKAKAVKKSQDPKKTSDDPEKEPSEEDGGKDEGGTSQQQSQAGRAKSLLLKRKLEEKERIIAEKDEVIQAREGQLEAKQRILCERDSLVNDLTQQLEERTKALEAMQESGGGGEGQVQEMYAQMVYKDRKIMEMNSKILDQDKRIMDLQEFAGEKDQVIRGRTKVVEVLQNSIKEKEQAVQDQAMLITKLTARVESTNEKMDILTEELRHKEHDLKMETERFHIKLTESQKYFEEMLRDMDVETKRLRSALDEKEKALNLRESDLRELIAKHERDIEAIMSKENIDVQDHVIKMLESKMKDTNDLLDGKIKVISVLQAESSEREKKLAETNDALRLMREKLQATSEQVMLMQANFVDTEKQWSEEKARLEAKNKEMADKHEAQLSERDLQVQTLQSTLSQYESAYNQASLQYSKLQEYYQQALAGHVDPEQVKEMTDSSSKAETAKLSKELAEARETADKLSTRVKELEDLRHKSSSAPTKEESKSDAKNLKAKAQAASKIKALEKEIKDLKENTSSSDEIPALKRNIEELEKEKTMLKEKQAELESTKASVDELKAQSEKLQAEVDIVHTEKARQEQELNEAREELSQLNKIVEDLKATMDTASDDQASALQEAKSSLRQVEAERDDLKQEVEKMKTLCDDLTSKAKSSAEKMNEQVSKQKDLEEEVASLKAELEEKSSLINQTEADRASLQADIARITEQAEGLEKEKMGLEEEVENYKEKLQQEREHVASMQSENGELKVKMNELEEAMKYAQEADKSQKDELNLTKSSLSALELEMKDAKEKLVETEANLQKAEQDKVSLTQELEQVSQEAVNLQAQMASLADSKQQLEAEIKRLTQDLSNVTSELEASTQQMEALKEEYGEEINCLRSKSDSLIQELNDKIAQLEKATLDLTAANETISSLKSSLEESQSSYSDMELENKKLARELDVLKEGKSEQGKEFDEKTNSLLTQLAVLESEVSRHQKINSDQEKTISKLSSQLQDKEEKLESVSFNIEELKTTLWQKEEQFKQAEEEHMRSLNLLKSSLTSTQEELVCANNSISELRTTLESKDTELAQLRDSSTDLQNEVDLISKELQSSSNQVVEFRAQNASLQEQIASYSDKLSNLTKSLDEDSQQMQQVVESLQQEKETQETLVASLERQVVSLEAEVQAARANSAEKDAQIAVLGAAHSEQEHRADGLQTSLVKLCNERDALNQQSKPSSNTDGNTNLRSELEHAEPHFTQEDLLLEKDVQLELMSQEMQGLRLEADSLRQTVSVLKKHQVNERMQANATTEALRLSIATLKDELLKNKENETSLKLDLEQFRLTVSKLEEELKEEKQSVTFFSSEAEALQSKLIKQQEELDLLRLSNEEHQNFTSRGEELSSKISKLEQEIEEKKQLKATMESLQIECDQLRSSLSKYEEDLNKEKQEKEELERQLKKKEKVIQGLHLKAKKAAKLAKAEGEAATKPEDDPFMTMSWSQNEDDMSDLTPEERQFRQLLAQYQSAAVERDTLKELIQEKDAEIVRLQTQYYDAELQWKEVTENLDAENCRLRNKLQKEGNMSSAFSEKERMLEEELKVATSELMSTSQMLEATMQSNKLEAGVVQDLQDKLQSALASQQYQQDKIDELESELIQMQTRDTFLQSQVAEREDQLKNVQDCLEKAKAEIISEKNNFNHARLILETEIGTLKQKLSGLEKGTQNNNSNVLQSATSNDAGLIESLKAEVTKRDEQISVMESVMKEMYGAQDENSSRIDTLSADLETVKNEVTNLQTEKAEMQKLIKKKEAKIAALSKRVNTSTPKKEKLHLLPESPVVTESEGIQNSSMGPDQSPIAAAENSVNLSSPESNQDENEVLRAEIHGLRKLIKKKDVHILTLNKKMKSLQAEQGQMSAAPSQESVTGATGRTSSLSHFDSGSTLFSDNVSDMNERLKQVEFHRDALESQVRELEVELENLKEDNLSLRHSREDVEEEMHYVVRDKRALEDCLFDIRDIANAEAVEELAGEDLLYATVESVRLMVEEKVSAERHLSELQKWAEVVEKKHEEDSRIVAESKAAVQRLESDLAEARHNHEQTWSQLEQTITTKANLEEQLEALRGSMQEQDLQEMLRESSLTIKTLQENVQKTMCEKKELEFKLHSIEEGFSQKMVQNQEDLKQLNKQLQQATEEKEEISRQYSSLYEQLQSYQSSQAAAEEYVIQLQAQMRDTEAFYVAKIDGLSSKLSEAESENAKLQEVNELTASLNAKIESQEKLIEALQAETSASTQISAELVEAQTKISDLRTMLKSKEAKFSTLSLEHDDLAVQYEKLQRQLEAAEAANISLKEHSESIETSELRQRSELQSLEEQLTYYRTATQHLNEECASIQAQLHHAHAGWSRDQEAQKELQEELEALKKHAHEVKEELDKERQLMHDIQQEKKRLLDQLERYEEQRSHEYNMLQSELEQVRDSGTSTAAQLNILESMLAEKNTALEGYTEQIQSIYHAVGDPDCSFFGLAEKVQELKEKAYLVESQSQTISSLQNDLVDKSNALASLEGELNVLKMSSSEKTNRLEQELHNLRSELQLREETSRGAEANAVKKVSNLQEAISLCQKDKEKAVDLLQSSVDHLTAENEHLKSENTKQAESIQLLESQLGSCKEEIEKYQEDIALYEKKIKETSSEIEVLQTKLYHELEGKEKDVNDLRTLLTEKQQKLSYSEQCVSSLTDSSNSLRKQVEELMLKIQSLEGLLGNQQEKEAKETEVSQKTPDSAEKLKALQKTLKKKDAKIVAQSKKVEQLESELKTLKAKSSQEDIDKSMSASSHEDVVLSPSESTSSTTSTAQDQDSTWTQETPASQSQDAQWFSSVEKEITATSAILTQGQQASSSEQQSGKESQETEQQQGHQFEVDTTALYAEISRLQAWVDYLHPQVQVGEQALQQAYQECASLRNALAQVSNGQNQTTDQPYDLTLQPNTDQVDFNSQASLASRADNQEASKFPASSSIQNVSLETQSLHGASTKAQLQESELQAAAVVRFSLEARVEELAASLAHSQTKLQEMEAASAALGQAAEAERLALETELEKTGNDLAKQFEARVQLESRLAKAEQEINAKKEVLNASEDHNKMLESKLYQMERDMIENSEREAETEMEMGGLQMKTSSLEKELARLSELQKKLPLVEAERDELKVHLESAVAQADSTRSLLQQLQSSSSEKEQEVVQQLLAKSEEVISLQQQLDQTLAECKELQSNLAGMETKTNQLEESLVSTQEQLNAASKMSLSLQAELASKDSCLQELLSSFESEKGVIRSEKEALEIQKHLLENQLIDLQPVAEQVPLLKEKLLEVEREKVDLKEAYDRVQMEASQHLHQLEDLSSQVKELSEQCAQLDEEKKNLESNLSELQQERDALYVQVTNFTAEAGAAESLGTERLSTQLAERDALLQERTKQFESLVEEKESLAKQLKQLEQEGHVKDQKIESLLENLQETEARLVQLEESATALESTGEGSALASSSSEELETIKTTLANKELMMKKALATAKKLKYQLNEARKELASAKAQLEEVSSEKNALEVQLANQKKEDPNREITHEKEQVVEETIVLENSSLLQTPAPEASNKSSLSPSECQSSELTLEVESMRTQMATFREVCQQLQEQMQVLTEEKHSLEAQLHQQQTQVEQLEGVRDGLKLTVTEVEAAYQRLLEDTDQSQVTFDEERTELEKKCKILEEQGQQWKSFMETLQGEVAAKEAKIQELGLELERAESQDLDQEGRMRHAMEQKDAELLEISSQLESIQNLLRNESQVSDEFKKKYESAEENLGRLEQISSEQREKLSTNESELNQLRETIQERETEMAGLQESLHLIKSEQETNQQAWQAQISSLDNQIEEYKNKLVEMTAQLDGQQEEKEKVSTLLQHHEVSLREREDQISVLSAQLDIVNQEAEKRQAEAETLRQQLNEQSAQVAELSGIVDSLKLQVEEEREQPGEADSLRQAVSQFQQQLEEQQAVISSLETRLTQGHQLEPDVNTSVSSADQESATACLKTENQEDLLEKLASYQDTVEQLSQEVISLSQDNERLSGDVSEDSAARLHRLQEEIDELAEEKNRLREQLDKQLNTAKKMQDIVSDKLSQAESLQASYERMQTSMAVLATEKEELLEQVNTLNAEINTLQQAAEENQLVRDELAKVSALRDDYFSELEKLRASLKAESSFTEQVQVMEKPLIAGESLQQASAPLTEAPMDASGGMAQLQAQYEKTKSKLQVTEVKCEKMLIKLKSFKDKNDRLQAQVVELQQKLQVGSSSDEFQEIRKQQEAQISSLDHKLHEAETYCNQLVSENTSLKSQLQDLEAEKHQLAGLNDHLASLQKEMGEKDLAVVQAQADLDQEREEKECVKAAFETKAAENENLEVKVKDLVRDLQLKQTEVSQLQAELDTRQKLEEAGDKTQKLQDLLIAKSHETEEVKGQLAEKTRELSSLESRIVTLEEEVNAERKRSEKTLEEELRRLREENSSEIAQIQAQLSEKCAQCDLLERQKTEGVQITEALKADLVKLEEKIVNLSTELGVERERAINAERAVKELQQRLGEEELKQKTLLKERDAVEGSELNSLKSQLESMRSQYESLSNDNENYQSLVTTLTSHNSAMKREVEELRFKLKKAGVDQGSDIVTPDSKKAVADLLRRAEEAEKERDELNEEFEEVREELIELRREKASLAQQATDLTNTVQQLNSKVAELEIQLNSSDTAKVTSAPTELPIKVERSTPLGSSPKDSSPKHQAKLDEELRSELSASQAENRELQAELDRLSWQIGELEGTEQELEELRSTLTSANMEKKILAHDLDEVRAELSALQTDKHLLMKEVERLGECVKDVPVKEKGKDREHPVDSTATMELLACKEKELGQIQKAFESRTNDLEAALQENKSKDAKLRDQGISMSSLEEVNRSLADQLTAQEERASSLAAELDGSRLECASLRKKLDNFNLKLDTVRSLEADFDSLNQDFTKVLEEKSAMADQIEELHQRVQTLLTQQQTTVWKNEQQQHMQREKDALLQRVAELEEDQAGCLQENAQLKQEVDRLSSALQQAEFAQKSMTSELQLVRNSSGDNEGKGTSSNSLSTSNAPTISRFHEEYQRLQAQFNEVMEQKSQLATQLTEAAHTIKQREARCQQLAMQVSQLAEDRGYLNTQLAHISKSLREKEQEWLAMRHQYAQLYQAYLAAQAKTADLERRIALESVQKELDDEETAAEADQVRVQSDQTEGRLEELQSAYQSLQDSHNTVSAVLNRERELREQLESELGQAHEHIKVLGANGSKEVKLQLEEESSRIRATTTMLTRHEMGYLNRLQSWISLKKSYFSLSSRQLNRMIRLRPGMRTLVWGYFIFLHLLLFACFGGFL